MTASSERGADRAEVDRFLTAVQLRCEVEVSDAPSARPAMTLLHVGGKQLRARLLWWSAKATARRNIGPDDSMLVRAAAAIELAHLGSLLHDDIVDGSESRRGVATLHLERGTRIAADAGASLAHLASMLLAPLGAYTRRAVRRATLALCRGQIRELAQAFVIVSPRERVAIMQEKTAALFELTAGIGAALAAADCRQHAAVKRFARRFGVAFQIADDVLDLAGDPAELGRCNGADLREGVMTLPVLLAAARDPRLVDLVARLQRSRSTDAIVECTELIARSDAIAKAAELARWWLARAIAALNDVAPSAMRQSLEDLAQASVERGLTPGRVSYSSKSVGAPLPFNTRVQHTSLLERECAVHPQLARSLDWLLPGLSAVVSNAAARSDIRASRLERMMLHGHKWSADARRAAGAIALAHAIASNEALRSNPMRTIALADCLHCLAIATLCAGDDREHERIAQRARGVLPYATPEHGDRPLDPSRGQVAWLDS